MASFALPFSSLVCMHTNHLATEHYCSLYISLTVERYAGWGCILNSFMLSPYLVFLLSTSHYILILVLYLLNGLPQSVYLGNLLRPQIDT